MEDPSKTFVVPEKQAAAVPYFNFAPLQNAMSTLQQSPDAYANMFKILEEHPDENAIRKINNKAIR